MPKPAPLLGSPSARSMTVCDHRKTRAISPVSNQVAERQDAQANGQGRIADRLQQRHLFRYQPRRLTRPPRRQELDCRPGHADGQRRPCHLTQCTTPAGRRNCPESLARARMAVAHSMVRGAIRSAARSVVGGQRVGDPAGPLPTDPRCGDVAVGRPCAGAHVPAVRAMLVTGSLQMFCDQRGILVG